MDDDEILSRITKLLEQGCTMLAAHHDCGAPLFRCQGKVVCPVCSFVDETGSPAEVQPSDSSGKTRDMGPVSGRAHLPESKRIADKPNDTGLGSDRSVEQGDDELSAAIGSLRAALLARLRELTASVREEHDLHTLKRQLDCLEGMLRILRSLHG